MQRWLLVVCLGIVLAGLGSASVSQAGPAAVPVRTGQLVLLPMMVKGW